MKLIFTRGTFREKLFSSMLFTTLTTLMLCSSLLLIVFSSRMEDSARQEADTLISVVSSSISDLRDSTEKIGSKLNRNSLVINAMSGGGAFPQQTYYELYNATSGLRDYVQFYLYDTNGALQYSTSSAGHAPCLQTGAYSLRRQVTTGSLCSGGQTHSATQTGMRCCTPPGAS